MRTLVAIALCVPTLASAAPKRNTIVRVTQHKPPSCEMPAGGASRRPDPPTIDTPLARTKFLIRRGKTNTRAKIIAQVTTDKAGVFALDLPQGTYCVVTDDKRTPPATAPSASSLAAPSADTVKECEQELLRECDAVIVAPTMRGHVDIYVPCQPRCTPPDVGPAPAIHGKPV